MNNLQEIIGMAFAALAGGLGKTIFDHLRGSKKDAGALAIEMWIQVSKEQAEWRLVQGREIERLQTLVTDLQQDNARLLGKVAGYEAKIVDLQDDNSRLELRVKQLEGELEKQHTVTPGLVPA